MIDDIGTLVTNDPEIGTVHGAALVFEGGVVVYAGPKGSVPEGVDGERVDAAGRAVIPGFVDSHGHLVFAGDRAQEFAAKSAGLAALRAAGSVAAVDDCIAIHLIGHLQSNKSARAAELFEGIDSLDLVRLADRLNDTAARLGKRLPVLIEVKLSPEDAKSGVEPESGEYFLADTLDESVRAARAQYPSRLSHVLRVGHPAALQMGGAWL